MWVVRGDMGCVAVGEEGGPIYMACLCQSRRCAAWLSEQWDVFRERDGESVK